MGKEKQKSQTQESRAGLVLSVSRTAKALRKQTARKRMGNKTVVYGTACVEFLLTEFLRDAHARLGDSKTALVKAKHFNETLHDAQSPVQGVFPDQVAGLMMCE